MRLVRAPRNLGFVGACNLGAEHARGDHVMFLNNDTEVRQGWLDRLVDVVETRPDVGLVGSKLVYPDGRLQESGGIVWADGTGWNYGRLQPDQPWYQTLRDVDYCSGAAILVRRGLFTRIGGFDKRFAPAYYEDTDLAFAVRAAGYRTMVQPASVIVHHEGVTNGTDISTGVKRHQEINRAVFVDKWSVQLRDHFPEASTRAVWAASQRTAAGHRGGTVLVVDHQVPMPDKDSGSVRMTRILELLVGLGRRVVFMPLNNAVPEQYADQLYQLGVTVIAGTGEQLEYIRDAGVDLRLAILSRPHVAWQVLEHIREFAPDCTIAYDTVDLHFLRLGRQADLAAELGDTAGEQALRRRAGCSASPSWACAGPPTSRSSCPKWSVRCLPTWCRRPGSRSCPTCTGRTAARRSRTTGRTCCSSAASTTRRTGTPRSGWPPRSSSWSGRGGRTCPPRSSAATRPRRSSTSKVTVWSSAAGCSTSTASTSRPGSWSRRCGSAPA
ncbi:hypothetical protein GCM10029964_124230 [Kibdelosporangium lantanae]